MKKIISLVLAFMLVVCLSVPAFAVSSSIGNRFDRNISIKDFPSFVEIGKFPSELLTYAPTRAYFNSFISNPNDSNRMFFMHDKSINETIYYFIEVSKNSKFDIALNDDGSYSLVSYSPYRWIRYNDFHGSSPSSFDIFTGGPNLVPDGPRLNLPFSLEKGLYGGGSSSLPSEFQQYIVSKPVVFTDGFSSCLNVVVNYSYEDGTEAFSRFSGGYSIGDTYNIASPAIDGYAPDIAAVSGTITETSELTTEYHVTYRDMSRMVNVDYKYPDGAEAAPPVSGKYFVGDTYNIPSPDIDGYSPDIPTVSGSVLETSDPVTDYHVVYIETPCKLTVNYSFEDGTEAAPPFIGQYGKGERYSINSPRLAGYLANYPVVRGTFPTADTSDIVFDVVYRVDRSIITSGDFEPFTKGILETVAVIFMVCCSLYTVILSVKCVIELLRSMTR